MSFVQLLQRFFRVQKVDTMYYNVIHYIVSTFVELLQVWNFILQRALQLENLKVNGELLNGAPRPRPGATEAMASVTCV